MIARVFTRNVQVSSASQVSIALLKSFADYLREYKSRHSNRSRLSIESTREDDTFIRIPIQ